MVTERARKGPPRESVPAAEIETPVRRGGRVAHYEILYEIGRGGMGVIYRAHDSRLGRDVALKCPWRHLASDATGRERFLREARSASQLSHPHIVPIFEILKWDGLPWIAMELVEGSSLRTLLRDQGAMSLRRALAAGEGLADALRAAHEKGIIHRDINPNNVLIRGDGWPLLTDFGLAHVLTVDEADSSATTGSAPLTKPGHVLGTRGYMSPEQVLGKPVDPRSDIFSFGTVLYEMCTGRRAFAADDDGSANEAILKSEPLALSHIDRSLPAELERIVRKTLAKRPEDRHKDARELHADIVALRRQVESADYVPSSPLFPRVPANTAWAAGVALLAVVLAAIAWFWLPRPPSARFGGGSPRQITSDPGAEVEPAVSPDGGLIAYTALGVGRSDIWITDVKGASRLRLTDDGSNNNSPTWFPDSTALAWVSDGGREPSIWKAPRLGGAPVLIAPRGVDPAIAPDGKRIVFARANPAGHYRIVVATLDDPSQLVWLTGDSDGERDHVEPAWSPDGQAICYSDIRNLWLVSLDGGRPHRLTSEGAIDSEPAWSSDGRFIIFTSEREGTRALWRIPANGGSAERFTAGTGPDSHASISSDGARLVYSTYADDYDVVIVDLASGKQQLIRSLLYDASPSFAPDASALVFASTRRGGRFDLWRQSLSGGRATGAPLQLTDLPGTVNTPAFSPDGKWIAFKREVADRREIWVAPLSAGIPERFSDGRGKDVHPAWSPDGAQLVYVSERGAESHLWVAPIHEGRRTGASRQLTSGQAADRLPAWSPDGRSIAYVGVTQESWGVWTVPATGGPPSGPLARATQFGRLRWHKPTGWLWFSAVGAGGETRLWKSPPAGGQAVVAVAGEMLADVAPPGEFDLSSDGHLLAFTRQDIRGDIWLLEDKRSAY